MRDRYTAQEQENVRRALRRMRLLLGTWARVEAALPLAHTVMLDLKAGRGTISPMVVHRLAEFFGVGIEELLRGWAVPWNACPHCGRCP